MHRFVLRFVLLLAAATPAFAVQRVLEITAPATAAPGAGIQVSVRVSTDAGAGEQIGFLHVEYSSDDGKTWVGLCYEQNDGPAVTRHFSLSTGEADSKTLVRARVAFRGGVAGDVDYTGAAIRWNDSWRQWRQPPARWAEIVVPPP